jgi:NAD kinase
MSLTPRVVVVTRPTELDHLVDRHGTRGQAEFFLKQRGRTMAEVDTAHHRQADAVQAISAAIPLDWRRASVDRSDLARWLFAPEDVVVAVGQDGLVANLAKYLDGQPVVGVNPAGAANPGVLVQHDPTSGAELLGRAEARTANGQPVFDAISARAMVRVTTDSGVELDALNEIFIGQRSHQSARYTLSLDGGPGERQSSSGLLVSTGTGSTGWARSLWTERHCQWVLPGAESLDLSWFVREAWPSPATGNSLVEGVLAPAAELTIVAGSDSLVAFGDGIEQDRIELTWGQSATVSLADKRLNLVAS